MAITQVPTHEVRWEVRIDKDHGPANPNPNNYENLVAGDYVVDTMTLFRGRRNDMEPAQIGFCEVVLANNDGRWDFTAPTAESGWNPARTQLNVRGVVPAPYDNTYNLFTGWVDDWPAPNDDTLRATLRASDGLKYLSQSQTPESFWGHTITETPESGVASGNHWYRFDENHGTDAVDRFPGQSLDGIYQIRSGGGWSQTDEHRNYRAENALIRFDPESVTYNMNEHQRDMGAYQVPRMRLPSGPINRPATWMVGIWVKSFPWADQAQRQSDAEGGIPVPGSEQQPIWCQYDHPTEPWRGQYVGLFIDENGHFKAAMTNGGQYITLHVTTPNPLGWDGKPHLVWVGRNEEVFAMHIDGTGLGTGHTDRIADITQAPHNWPNPTSPGGFEGDPMVVGGYFMSQDEPSVYPEPWFKGLVSDLVVFDDVYLSQADCQDYWQAGANGIKGVGTDAIAVDRVAQEVLDISGYAIGVPDLNSTANMAARVPGAVSTLEYLQLCERTGRGRFDMKANGSPWLRTDPNTPGVPALTASNDEENPGEMWDAISIKYDLISDVYNDVTVEWWGGGQRAKDTTSISANGRKTLEWDTSLRNAGPARTLAESFRDLYKDPGPKCEWVRFLVNDDAQADTMLGIDLGDQINVAYQSPNSPGGPSAFQLTHFVEGIEHRISAGNLWYITFYLSRFRLAP